MWPCLLQVCRRSFGLQCQRSAAVLLFSDSLSDALSVAALAGSDGDFSPRPPHPEDVEAPNGSGRLSFSAFGSAPRR